MIQGIDHVALAVASLEECIPFYRDQLGLELRSIEEVPDQKVRVAIFALGSARLELLEPLSEDSPISNFLAQRGNGLHHIALRTEDVAAELTRLEGQGCRLIDKAPRPGAHGMQIAFVHPKSTHGLLLELSQPGG